MKENQLDKTINSDNQGNGCIAKYIYHMNVPCEIKNTTKMM